MISGVVSAAPFFDSHERRELAGRELVHELVHALHVRRDGEAHGGARFERVVLHADVQRREDEVAQIARAGPLALGRLEQARARGSLEEAATSPWR